MMKFRHFFVPVLFFGLFILGCTQALPTKPLIERNTEVKEYFEAKKPKGEFVIIVAGK